MAQQTIRAANACADYMQCEDGDEEFAMPLLNAMGADQPIPLILSMLARTSPTLK
jgi:hypothetical protein